MKKLAYYPKFHYYDIKGMMIHPRMKNKGVSMKNKLLPYIAILSALVFILMPLPASDLIIRIYFDEIAGDQCSLYYTTDAQPEFNPDMLIISSILESAQGQKMVEFRLDGSLESQLAALRLDWPHLTEQLICVHNIAVSSGGIIRKNYNPCLFFAEKNILLSNETSVTLVQPRNRAYLSTKSGDPWQILSDELTAEIRSCYSHKVVSRLLLCLFIAGSYFFHKKKVFS